MKLSFILFILPLVATAAQDGNLRDSSPVETANAAADRHHLRRVLTAESKQSCPKKCAPRCGSGQHCEVFEQPLPEGQIGVGDQCAQCVPDRNRVKDVDGSILEEE